MSTNTKDNVTSLPAKDDAPAPKAGSEIAVAYGAKDITRGFLLENMLAWTDDYVLMQQGGNDLRAYTEILRDEQVKACLEQRRSAVVSAELIVEPGGSRAIDKQAAEFLQAQLDKIGFDRVTDSMLYAVFYGFAAAEIIYEAGVKYLEWKSIKVRNPRRFGFTGAGEMRLRTFDSGLLGDPADPPYFWHVSYGTEYDDQPYGKGIAHWCYWPVKFKRNGIKYWMIFAEKFGTPTAVGKFPVGATDPDRANLLAAAAAMSTDAAVIIPESCALELVEAKRAGESGYAMLAQYFDSAISKAIIGQTMTSDNGSSKAQGQVHFAVRQDIVQSDSNLICDSFNKGPVAWLIGTNFPTAALPRVKRKIEEPADLNLLSERDQRITSVGYRPTQERVDETYGIGYEPIPEAAPQPVQPVDANAANQLPGAQASSGGGSATGSA